MSYRPPDTRNISIGRGKLLAAEWDAAGDVLGGFRPLGNCNSIEVLPEETPIELKSSMDEAGGTLVEDTADQKLTINVVGHERDIRNLALVLMGAESTLAQTLASSATCTIEDIKQGLIYRVVSATGVPIRSATITAITQGVTPLVLGTDYEIIDDTASLFRVIEGSLVATEGSDLTVTYDAPAITATDDILVTGAGSDTRRTFQLCFLPRNNRGPQYEHWVWECRAKPGGPLQLIHGQEYGTHALQFVAFRREDLDASFPFHKVIRRTAASSY